MGGEFSYYVRKVQTLREEQEPGNWRTTVLASWAVSTLETYYRQLRHLATAQYALACKSLSQSCGNTWRPERTWTRRLQTFGKSFQHAGYVRRWPDLAPAGGSVMTKTHAKGKTPELRCKRTM